jgi:hypothetical protein
MRLKLPSEEISSSLCATCRHARILPADSQDEASFLSIVPMRRFARPTEIAASITQQRRGE